MGITCYLTDLFAAEIESRVPPRHIFHPHPWRLPYETPALWSRHIDCNVAFSIEASIDLCGEMQVSIISLKTLPTMFSAYRSNRSRLENVRRRKTGRRFGT